MKRILRVVAVLLVLGVVAVVAIVVRAIRPDMPIDTLRERYGVAPSQYVELLGMPVHYRDEGHGPPVLLVHGTFASLHTWDGWTEALAKTHRVVRLDLPGHGLTGPDPTGRYDMARTLEVVAAFADRLGLDRFAIAGNSLGGHVAWRFAAAHPERVDALVLLNAAGYPREQMPGIIRLARTPVVNRLMLVATPERLVRRNLEQVYADDAKVTDDLVARYHALLLREGNRRAMLERLTTDDPLRPDLVPTLRVRTLVVWGALDTWVPPADGIRYEREIPGARRIEYPDLGHVPQEEAPARTARDVIAFLGG